jgi:hypothetical protein
MQWKVNSVEQNEEFVNKMKLTSQQLIKLSISPSQLKNIKNMENQDDHSFFSVGSLPIPKPVSFFQFFLVLFTALNFQWNLERRCWCFRKAYNFHFIKSQNLLSKWYEMCFSTFWDCGAPENEIHNSYNLQVNHPLSLEIFSSDTARKNLTDLLKSTFLSS